MTTAAPYSTLTITDALPDGRAFVIRYLSMSERSTTDALMADAFQPAASIETRKAGWIARLGLDPDAPPHYVNTWHASDDPCTAAGAVPDPERPRYCQHPDGRAWLAHWRDELARLNGTDSDTAKRIIGSAASSFSDAAADISRFVWALA